MATNMFSALETSWDQSPRRRWTTVASFSVQALGLSLLLAIPMLTVQGPPRLEWITSPFFAPPSAPAPRAPQHPQGTIRTSNLHNGILLQPPTIPHGTPQVNDAAVAAAPDFDDTGVVGGTGRRGPGVPGSTGDQSAFAPPPPPAPASVRPLIVSHWAEGNLIYRVQPSYPTLARQARIQGSVQLRAIISKNGTIENLSILSGHAMLVASAIEAVKQWRYRPYLLNGEPIEVETEITVNFVLSGS
jgi:periplasmic protein TonB